jgi:hypothetical protein
MLNGIAWEVMGLRSNPWSKTTIDKIGERKCTN